MNNPYVSRGPVQQPEMFYDRDHDLAEIAAFLRGNQSISIVGPRKIGKTSLLFHLMRPATLARLGLEDRYLFVYLDCEVLGEGPAQAIFGQFALEMRAALEDRQLPPEPIVESAGAKPSRLAFEAAVRQLNRRGLRVVLILDEFERLSANAQLDVNFFNALRSAAGRYQLAYITASARPLIQLTYSGRSQEVLSSPFFNIFAPLFLGLMLAEDARRLIHEPAARAGAPLPSEAQDFVLSLAGGHPLALQIACFHALDHPADPETIEREAMRELSAHFEYYWRNLSEAEQTTLRHLSDAAERQKSDTTLRGLLRDLEQKCLLVNDQGVYRYPSRAWEIYMAVQAPSLASTTRGRGSLVGLQIGHYEVLESIGRGGMAEVYKGRHTRLNRVVAIKVLPASLATEEDFRARFEREARSIAALRHPNIVQVFDFGDLEGMYYMVMEYISGKDLALRLREAGRLPLPEVLSLLDGVAGALDYAHAQGIVHRDVKPSNVMLDATADGGLRPILTDFGIAKMVAGGAQATQTGMLGTLDYMAPEQVRASREVDGRADIYALGVMAYQMLTGHLPFSGDSPGQIMLAHLQKPAPDPRTLAPDLPENAALALLKALAKNPADRYATARALVDALS
jgi:tRNA A-37 threonylcarbamoyl transferase component Bud32